MKILIVDDSFDWLNTHSLTLQALFGEDTEIVCACSAFEGFETYKSDYYNTPYDLVITDLQMEQDFEPMYAGEWLVKEIREVNPNQKILIVSSSYNIDQIAREYNTDYLSKQNILGNEEQYKNKLQILYK